MEPIEAIGVEQQNEIARRAAITQEDFLQVLLAQLQFQDPLEPLDNSEFIAQFAQLTNLEQTQQLNDKLDTVLTLQADNQAVNLLGRSVEFNTDTAAIIGEVSAITFANGVPALTVRGDNDEFFTDVSLGQIRVIR